MLYQVALVAELEQVTAAELCRVSAALQKQALRDFGPIWQVEPTVDAFISLDDVPIGYWPIIVEADIQTPGAGGVHLDKDGQPFALVQYSQDWSLTASHECLEMLADPFGNRLVAGQSPKPDQGRVEFLVEICDPSEAVDFSYTVNGVSVSDFYTPHFFDPVQSSGVRYSYSGAITGPREVLRGGYLSWHEPISDHWWQMTWFSGDRPSFRDLGVFTRDGRSLRTVIDSLTHPQSDAAIAPRAESFLAAHTLAQGAAGAAASRAGALRDQIAAIMSGAVEAELGRRR